MGGFDQLFSTCPLISNRCWSYLRSPTVLGLFSDGLVVFPLLTHVSTIADHHERFIDRIGGKKNNEGV